MSSRNKYANASTMASSFLFPYGSAISARMESTSDICLLYHPQVDVGLGHATEGGMQTYITTICNILFSKPYHSLLLSILPPPTPLGSPHIPLCIPTHPIPTVRFTPPLYLTRTLQRAPPPCRPLPRSRLFTIPSIFNPKVLLFSSHSRDAHLGIGTP